MSNASLKKSDVCGWVLHPGGRDVLLALREQLDITEHDVRWSEQVLREFGNVSSSSVFFVLEAAFSDSRHLVIGGCPLSAQASVVMAHCLKSADRTTERQWIASLNPNGSIHCRQPTGARSIPGRI